MQNDVSFKIDLSDVQNRVADQHFKSYSISHYSSSSSPLKSPKFHTISEVDGSSPKSQNASVTSGVAKKRATSPTSRLISFKKKQTKKGNKRTGSSSGGASLVVNDHIFNYCQQEERSGSVIKRPI